MTPIKRYAGATSAAVLLAFSLTACGGAPTDASKEDFCKAALDIPTEAEDAGKIVDEYKDYADKLNDVGTPKGISDDARDGFEVVVDAFGDLDEDDVKKAIEEGSDELSEVSKDDQKKGEAFFEYVGKECG